MSKKPKPLHRMSAQDATKARWKWDRRAIKLRPDERHYLEKVAHGGQPRKGREAERARRDRAIFLLTLDRTWRMAELQAEAGVSAPTLRRWKAEFFELEGPRRVLDFLEKANRHKGGKPRLSEDAVLRAWRQVVQTHGARTRIRHIEEVCRYTQPTIHRILRRHNITKENLWGANLPPAQKDKIAGTGDE